MENKLDERCKEFLIINAFIFQLIDSYRDFYLPQRIKIKKTRKIKFGYKRQPRQRISIRQIREFADNLSEEQLLYMLKISSFFNEEKGMVPLRIVTGKNLLRAHLSQENLYYVISSVPELAPTIATLIYQEYGDEMDFEELLLVAQKAHEQQSMEAWAKISDIFEDKFSYEDLRKNVVQVNLYME
jgi:hypothetical protein